MTCDTSALLDAPGAAQVRKEPRGLVQVRAKIVQKRTIEEANARARLAVGRLVQDAEASTGSRMIAYDRVGRGVGKSAAWVRRLLRDDGSASVQHVTALYGALCDRIEAAALDERRRAALLRIEADEALEGDRELVVRLAHPARRGAAP